LTSKTKDSQCLANKLSKKIQGKEENIDKLDKEIKETKSKQDNVEKKILQVETLLKHFVVNGNKTVCCQEDFNC